MSNRNTGDTPRFFKVKGKAFWSHIKERDTKGEYPSNAFKLDLSIDVEHKKSLQKLGVQIKNKGNELGDFVTLKSKNFQPQVILPDGTPCLRDTVDEEGNIVAVGNIPLIGNGSEVTITASLYNNTPANIKAGKGGEKCLGMSTIQLHTLVPYEVPNLVG